MKPSLARLDALIWTLIYAGLGTLAVGLALRDAAGVHAALVGGLGAGVALAGAALIGLRARLVRVARAAAPSAATPNARPERDPDSTPNPRKPS